jgi:hypothetical protein
MGLRDCQRSFGASRECGKTGIHGCSVLRIRVVFQAPQFVRPRGKASSLWTSFRGFNPAPSTVRGRNRGFHREQPVCQSLVPAEFILRTVQIVRIHTNPKRKRGTDLASSLTLRVSVSLIRARYIPLPCSYMEAKCIPLAGTAS